MRPARRRVLRVTVFALALLVAAWLLSAVAALRRITARPLPHYAEPVPLVAFGALTETRLVASDGVETGAWWCASETDGPSVVLAHGYKGSRGVLLDKASIWKRAGASVLLLTLRAHGDAAGERNDFGWGARLDIVAAVRFVEQQRPHARIVVCGASLGAAAAAFAAPDLGERVRAWVLECPYVDVQTAAWRRCQLALPPVLDAIAYAGLQAVAPVCFPEMRAMDVGDALRRGAPDAMVLVLGGRLDVLAPLQEQRAIVARVGPRAHLVVLEAEHDRLVSQDRASYEREVRDLVAQLR